MPAPRKIAEEAGMFIAIQSVLVRLVARVKAPKVEQTAKMVTERSGVAHAGSSLERYVAFGEPSHKRFGPKIHLSQITVKKGKKI